MCDNEDSKCAICLAEPMVRPARIVRAYHQQHDLDCVNVCGHLFCHDCLYEHIYNHTRGKKQCPLCRHPALGMVEVAGKVSPAFTQLLHDCENGKRVGVERRITSERQYGKDRTLFEESLRKAGFSFRTNWHGHTFHGYTVTPPEQKQRNVWEEQPLLGIPTEMLGVPLIAPYEQEANRLYHPFGDQQQQPVDNTNNNTQWSMDNWHRSPMYHQWQRAQGGAPVIEPEEQVRNDWTFHGVETLAPYDESTGRYNTNNNASSSNSGGNPVAPVLDGHSDEDDDSEEDDEEMPPLHHEIPPPNERSEIANIANNAVDESEENIHPGEQAIAAVSVRHPAVHRNAIIHLINSHRDQLFDVLRNSQVVDGVERNPLIFPHPTPPIQQQQAVVVEANRQAARANSSTINPPIEAIRVAAECTEEVAREAYIRYPTSGSDAIEWAIKIRVMMSRVPGSTFGWALHAYNFQPNSLDDAVVLLRSTVLSQPQPRTTRANVGIGTPVGGVRAITACREEVAIEACRRYTNITDAIAWARAIQFLIDQVPGSTMLMAIEVYIHHHGSLGNASQFLRDQVAQQAPTPIQSVIDMLVSHTGCTRYAAMGTLRLCNNNPELTLASLEARITTMMNQTDCTRNVVVRALQLYTSTTDARNALMKRFQHHTHTVFSQPDVNMVACEANVDHQRAVNLLQEHKTTVHAILAYESTRVPQPVVVPSQSTMQPMENRLNYIMGQTRCTREVAVRALQLYGHNTPNVFQALAKANQTNPHYTPEEVQMVMTHCTYDITQARACLFQFKTTVHTIIDYEHDVQAVMSQAGITHQQAVDALHEHGNVVDAILATVD